VEKIESSRELENVRFRSYLEVVFRAGKRRGRILCFQLSFPRRS